MKKTILRKYAKLIARVGVKIRKGQDVVIQAELDQPEFVEMLTDECYKAGARKVTVEWSHQPLQKYHVRHRSLKTLSTLDDWEVAKLEHYADTLPCRIYLISEDPDGLCGINQEKNAKALQARYKVIKPIRDKMENKYQWCIAAVPGVKWAKKVFPGERASRAVELLWEAILKTSRVDEDPEEAWRKHNEDLARRCEYLNSLGIESLEYKSSNGTDLKVGMIPDALFCGGGEYALGSGNYFNPNIPSEEVFTTPKRGEAEGIVYSTKPLSYRGELIEDFSIRFEGGRAVEVKAKRGEELLKQMISMDEGASYLGECALVPYDSPVQKFGNTLLQYSCSTRTPQCHLALGMGSRLPESYEKYTLDECREKGINDSQIHEDFMIGSEDLSITAHTRDGRDVPIFRDGNWAF